MNPNESLKTEVVHRLKWKSVLSPKFFGMLTTKIYVLFSGLNSFKIRLKEWFYITQFRKKGDLLRHFLEFTSFLY